MDRGSVVTRVVLVAALAGLLAGCVSCARIRGMLVPPVGSQATDSMRVGAAQVEITPLPGVPMSGYALRGTVARGHWLRLYAKALYVEGPDGVPLVLVSADLWSVADGLSDRVAEIVRGKPGGGHLGRDNLILAATHTHHSFGGVASSSLYNSLSASRPGFDPKLFEFLAQRIAEAVVESSADAAPGSVRLTRQRLPSFFRNRALEPFSANVESDSVMDANRDVKNCVTNDIFSDFDSCLAVDASVSAITLLRNDAVIGAGIFLGVHPTAMGPNLQMYSSDVFGVASILGGRSIMIRDRTVRPPVLAFFNGAEGDVAPQWKHQDRPNTMALGGLLAEQVVRLVDAKADSATAVTGSVNYRFDPAVTVPGQDVASEGGASFHTTAARMSAGRATLAGAADGRTMLHGVVWYDGAKGPNCGDQGVKWPLLDPGVGCVRLPLTALSMLITAGPRTVPLGVYQIGRLALATFPGEPTTVVGLRTRAKVAAALGLERVEDVLLVGLANGYASYFATPEEYQFQFYEGASTLYGEHSAPFISQRLGLLARCLRDPVEEACANSTAMVSRTREFDYAAGLEWSFGMETVRPMRIDDLRRLGPLLPQGDDPAALSKFEPERFCWADEYLELPPPHAVDALVNPTVTIQVGEGESEWQDLSFDGFVEDDFGTNVVTLGKMRNYDGSDWCSFWLVPDYVDVGRMYRFAVTTPGGQTRESDPFMLKLAGD